MSKEDLIKYLNNIFPLSIELQKHLYAVLKSQHAIKKQYLLESGKVSQRVYFVKSGLVRAFYIKKGKEFSSWFMKEGDVVFSVESFYKQTPSFEYIECLEDSVVYYITYDELQFIYRNFIEFNYVRGVLTEKYYALSEERVRIMRMQAKDRYQFLLNNHFDLIDRVAQKYLSSYLGISEETLSRKRNDSKIDKYQ